MNINRFAPHMLPTFPGTVAILLDQAIIPKVHLTLIAEVTWNATYDDLHATYPLMTAPEARSLWIQAMTDILDTERLLAR